VKRGRVKRQEEEEEEEEERGCASQLRLCGYVRGVRVGSAGPVWAVRMVYDLSAGSWGAALRGSPIECRPLAQERKARQALKIAVA
jgi:hypothetical protein